LTASNWQAMNQATPSHLSGQTHTRMLTSD